MPSKRTFIILVLLGALALSGYFLWTKSWAYLIENWALGVFGLSAGILLARYVIRRLL